MTETNRLANAIAKIDEANGQDPHQETFEGESLPKELVYSIRMTRWLERLAPDASDELRLAARCQHVCRWKVPRDNYPWTRAGYRQWRSDMADFHSVIAGEILREVGYEESTIARVQALLHKENLKTDPEAQLLEDVICVVFMESYFADFSQEHEEEKLLTILRKTWRKMSERGHQTVLQLELPERSRELLEKALATP